VGPDGEPTFTSVRFYKVGAGSNIAGLEEHVDDPEGSSPPTFRRRQGDAARKALIARTWSLRNIMRA
jgi:hypothetical protein